MNSHAQKQFGDAEEIKNATDEELIPLILKKPNFFIHLVERYASKLRRYIIRISGATPDDADDLLQESFIDIYRNLNSFDVNLKFSSWAYRITHNRVVSNFRKMKSRPQQFFSDGDDDFIKRIASDLDLANEVNNRLNREIILQVLNSLDYKYKEILELRFLEEKDYQEISDILRKPMGTVATTISRAKKKFKEELKKQKIKL